MNEKELTLDEQQRKRAIEIVNEYLSAPPGPEGKTPVELEAEVDAARVKFIETKLKPLLAGYLAGKVPLADFKSKVDGINKLRVDGIDRRTELWGFVLLRQACGGRKNAARS